MKWHVLISKLVGDSQLMGCSRYYAGSWNVLYAAQGKRPSSQKNVEVEYCRAMAVLTAEQRVIEGEAFVGKVT